MGPGAAVGLSRPNLASARPPATLSVIANVFDRPAITADPTSGRHDPHDRVGSSA